MWRSRGEYCPGSRNVTIGPSYMLFLLLFLRLYTFAYNFPPPFPPSHIFIAESEECIRMSFITRLSILIYREAENSASAIESQSYVERVIEMRNRVILRRQRWMDRDSQNRYSSPRILLNGALNKTRPRRRYQTGKGSIGSSDRKNLRNTLHSPSLSTAKRRSRL